MTKGDQERLREQLSAVPEDWNVRIALIECLAGQGDLAGAKHLVRTSPDCVATPPEIQVRLHDILTQPSQESSTLSEGSTASFGDSGGAALIEDDFIPSFARRRSLPPPPQHQHHSSLPPPPRLRRNSSTEKWSGYDGRFHLATLNLDEKAEAPSTRSQRISSVSFALLIHVLAALLLGLAVVRVQRPEPPQIIASVAQQRDTDMIPTQVSKPRPETTYSAALGQSIDVVTAIAVSSNFSIPEMDIHSTDTITATIPGIGVSSLGMDLSGSGSSSSNVTFFGLSGKGDRIVFIIDASPSMLVDEKGGMSAYNNVKNEIGIMLSNLNRATHFNLILYEGKKIVSFRSELVPALPSNLRQAIEWLDPVNRDYFNLGLRENYGSSLEVEGGEHIPIQPIDIAHYGKAIEKAIEWSATTVFSIVSGYRGMVRTPDEATKKKIQKSIQDASKGRNSTDPREVEAWEKAQIRTREWLEKENTARRKKGLDQKVVTNFAQLVREITGARPPAGIPIPNLVPPITREDVEKQISYVIRQKMKEEAIERPSINVVLFLGENEQISDDDDKHFKNLTRRNHGKLKVLRGLAALQNVTNKTGEMKE